MKGIYFASFYFRVWDLTREIRENKNPAKISTYTVIIIVSSMFHFYASNTISGEALCFLAVSACVYALCICMSME